MNAVKTFITMFTESIVSKTQPTAEEALLIWRRVWIKLNRDKHARYSNHLVGICGNLVHAFCRHHEVDDSDPQEYAILLDRILDLFPRLLKYCPEDRQTRYEGYWWVPHDLGTRIEVVGYIIDELRAEVRSQNK